ncbi:hydrolase or metal-binding protein, partial [Acinetobacter baumannii]|uniref:recombination directionality factor n=1 Tax=Acinetobacter baumannii TaxID=470 RepID=UPI00112D9C1D
QQLRSKAPNQKLRTIPVRMIFNDPELNLRAEYSLFDRQTGRPVCVGNGETCQRLTNQGVEQHPCPSPDLCSLAQGGNCKPYGRLHVNLDESDELGTFIFRTTGFNSIRTLAARLSYYHAASNGLLSCLPLQLTLRGKSTTQSYRQPVYYVDLTLKDGVNLQQAIQMAQEIDQQSKQAGFNQTALDQTARQGFANAQFEVNAEEGLDLVEEFYMDENQETNIEQAQPLTMTRAKVKDKSNHEDGFVQDIQKGLQGSVRAIN